MLRLALLVAGALAAPAPAQTLGPPYMPGVWSLGETRNYRGVARVSHRCPENALKANAAQGEH